MLLGDFSAKVGRVDVFKPTIGYESSHEISNDSVVRVVNFATSKNLVVNSTMFPQRDDIRTYTWISPEGKTHVQIDHVLIDRRRHSSGLHARSFRGTDCDTHRCLVAEKMSERLALTVPVFQKIGIERFNLKK
jgi:hypothetical protein